MHSHRPVTLALGTFALCVSVTSTAFAAGLVAFDDAGAATQLAELNDLSVEVSLTETDASIVETRRYVLLPAAEPRTVRFYHAVGEAVDPESYAVRVGESIAPTTFLARSAAETRQTELLRQLREPGVLRGFGATHAESVAGDVEPDQYVTFEVRVEYRRTLADWDTMRAIRLPIDWQEHAVSSMNVTVDAQTAQPLRALYSPFHALESVRRSDREVTASFRGWEVCTTNELTLLLSTGTDDVHLDVLPFRYGDTDGGFFMAFLTPSTSTESMPRDLVFVVDTSGSMKGEKMEQAREALRGVIAGLSPKDRFTVVEFDGNVKVLDEEAQTASSSFVADANQFVADLVADGATNLSDALRAGFDALPFTRDRPRYIVVLTDGQPTEGETDTEAILDLVRVRNEVGARLFAFGIGNDVNTVLLDRLALESSGDAIYVRPGESVVGPVDDFFARIASAALVDPRIESTSFGGLRLVYPERLPDLYANQTLAVVGRYESGGTGEIVLRGTRGAEQVETRWEVDLPEHSTHNAHVPRVWATRHVGTLLHQIKLGDDDPRVPLEATAIATRFGVITEFTNFVLDERGNAVMQYTDVPLDVTGSTAVDTSASLDGYQNTGSASMRFEDFVRYAADRTFPTFDGWYTDTSVADRPDWLDLHFGSDLFIDVVAREAAIGITGFLAVSRDVAFEFHGREIRVSDALSEREVPRQTARIPAAVVPPSTPARVHVVREEATPSSDPWVDADDAPETDPREPEESEVYVGGGGCATANGSSPLIPGLLFGLVAACRIRRAARRVR